MPSVRIVGAGIAGLSAALRLAERGFDVTVYEQNDFLGGKLGAHREGNEFYEHSYHMYLSWYHNFWQIVGEAGVGDRFVARRSSGYIDRDRHNRIKNLTEYAVPWETWRTLYCGVLPPADMLIWGYSIIDLLGTPSALTGHLDRMSVNGFMTSRPYMTPAAAGFHGNALAKAFAVPSYLSAVRSYKSFLKYGTRLPDPMMWLLAGNTEEFLFAPIRALIKRAHARHGGGSFTVHLLHRVVGLEIGGKRVAKLAIEELAESPSSSADEVAAKRRFSEPVADDVIVAVPPQALNALVGPEIYKLAPELGRVRRLLSEPMPSLVIQFKRKLRNIPEEIVDLLGSRYGLSFLDLSPLWGLKTTTLNVVVSDFSVLSVLNRSDLAALEGRPRARTAAVRTAEKEILELVLSEMRHYIIFNDDDIDRARCHLQTNVGEPLFVNEVGSWQNRPRTTTAIPNLFLAGDYCQTAIDVVTIEGAVVSGLTAAEAVRRRAGIGSPIRIVEPDYYPGALFAALATLGAPYAYAAKAWSLLSEELGWELGRLFPSD